MAEQYKGLGLAVTGLLVAGISSVVVKRYMARAESGAGAGAGVGGGGGAGRPELVAKPDSRL